MSIKISEMPAKEGDYNPNPDNYTPPTYDPDTGGVMLAVPVFATGIFNQHFGGTGDSGHYVWVGTPEPTLSAALPIVELNIDGTVSSNNKVSITSVATHLLSNRRRIYKTDFENVRRNLAMEQYAIDLMDAGFSLSGSAMMTKALIDHAYFDFGRITVGEIDNTFSNVLGAGGDLINKVNRRYLRQWGDKIRFAVSAKANLAFHAAPYNSDNLKLNIGFGSFYNRADEVESPKAWVDTADTFGMAVNVVDGKFMLDWRWSGESNRFGQYDTGIYFGSTGYLEGGDFSVVMDIDVAVGMKLTLASPMGTITTLNFPLLDPSNQGLGMSYDALFGEGGTVGSLPHSVATDGVGNLNDDYYKICAALALFLGDDESPDGYSGHVAFGMSRLQYDEHMNDAGLALQQLFTGDEWSWGGYNPREFGHVIELKGMYFESEINDKSPANGGYGNTFNLATLGRALLNPLDKHVADGGNTPSAP